MDKKKTFADEHQEEIFTDNTKIKKCEQCKDCGFWNDGTEYSHYTKSSCRIFKYPLFKPMKVVQNKGNCEFYQRDAD